MVSTANVVCDGCGQGTTSEHIAHRVARLEQTTRYRPIHIQAVFLCAQSPTKDAEFLYAGNCNFEGEALALLETVGIKTVGRDADSILSEFQRNGYFLTHVIECAPENGAAMKELTGALRKKLPSVLKRLRTSLKPKKIFLISPTLSALCDELKNSQIAAELILDGAKPFDFADAQSVNRLRSRL